MKCKNYICCCKCKFQVELLKHPWNKLKEARGQISETFGYGCKVFRFPEGKNKHSRKIVFSDRKHGMCELFEGRKR